MNNPLKEFRPESLCLLKETQDDYWCFARKGPQDFSVYTEKSSIYETPSKDRFRESADVLVRWTDGLLYLATIIQVEEEYSRCAVKFEDGSQFWALYKDIYKGPLPENEFACTICDSSSSQPPDEIVICDKCSAGYHQLCHIPKLDAADLNPEIPWNCRKCVFASAAKKGGASKKGLHAQAMLLVKQTLPYDMKSLTWDSSHRSNLQQIYCYCGGPGEWYSKMLQCNRCKQWFHEACLQCLEDPLLLGDRYYIFVCSVCNKGPEFLRRLPIKWADIAHLVLFNLTVMHGKKFFELDSNIMTFLKENWSQFKVKGESMGRLHPEERKKKMLEYLQNTKSRFTSGKEMKKKTRVWGLRSRVPPSVPIVSLPESGVVTSDVFDAFCASSRKSKLIAKPNSIHFPVKRHRKLSMDTNHSKLSEETEGSKLSEESSCTDSAKRIPRMEKLRKLRSRESDTTSSELSSKSVPRSDTTSSESSEKTVLRRLRLRRTSARESDVASSETSSKSASRSEKSNKSSEDTHQGQLLKKKVRQRLPQQLSRKRLKGLQFKKMKRSCLTDMFDCDDSSSRDTLNSIIPAPTSFDAFNNPFLSTYTLSCYVEPQKRQQMSSTNSESCLKIRIRPSRKFGARPVVSEMLNTKSEDLPKSKLRSKLKTTEVQSKGSSESDLAVTTRITRSSSRDLSSSISNFFDFAKRTANGEKYSVLAKRVGESGEAQYLVEWDS